MSHSPERANKNESVTYSKAVQKVLTLAMERTPIEFRITEGGGAASANRVNRKEELDCYPILGVDVCAIVNGKVVREGVPLAVVGGVILSCAKELGVNWDWVGFWKPLKGYPHSQTTAVSSKDPGQLPTEPR